MQQNKLSPAHIEAVNRQRRIINQEDANGPCLPLGMDISKWIEHRFDLIDTQKCQIDTIFWDVELGGDSYAGYLNSKLLPPLDLDVVNKW